MEKMKEHISLRLSKRGSIIQTSSRNELKHAWSSLDPAIFVCLWLAAATSSSRWCTSTTAQPVQAPAMAPIANGTTDAPAPAPAPIGNPTDPAQLATFYRMSSWPTVWRQHGTIPNISDLTIPTRDVCMNNASWIGVRCDGGSPYQFIVDIQVPDMAGGYPDNFLLVMANLTTLQILKIYQKGDKATSSLSGVIPPSIGQLVHLQELNFRGNQLSGPVPPEVAHLPSLVTLNLADNHLTGNISQFCLSKSLQTLLLFDNAFSEVIPPCMGSMNLTNLNLGANFLTGPIPDTFAKLVNLQSLNIDNTTLSGGLSNSMVAAWTQLTGISLLRSNLSGPIPDALGSLKLLTGIQLGLNEFSGSIPPSLGNLSSLSSLALYDNRLTGPIPAELGMTNLTTLLLYNNSLSGSIPPDLARLSYLQHVHLQGNNFSGAINGSLFSNWTGLKALFLQENGFTGTFPSHDIFNSCMSLVNVSLSFNNFEGPVLEPNTTLPANLSLLLMSYNKFSGPIPQAFGEANALQFLDLANNSLTGDVPAEVTTKATATPAQINLSFNSLNVSYHNDTHPGFGLFTCHPKEASCTEYRTGSSKGVAINVGGPDYMDFEADVATADNSIGMFKSSPSSKWSLSTTGVDGGYLLNSSQNPSNLDTVADWGLYTTARSGADSFTYYIQSLLPGSKYKLDLGFVELVEDLRVGERVFDIWIQGQLQVQAMDVMQRASGQFRVLILTFDVGTAGDSGLLTVELRGHGSSSLAFNKRVKQGLYFGPILSSLRVYQPKEFSKIAKIGIIAGSTAGGLILALVLVLLGLVILRRRRRLQAMKDEHSGLGLTFFRYSELEAATNRWSAKSLIGEGAFGKVYRGVLADGTIVAIKQLVVKADGPLWTKEAFLNEARIISTTRHRNLIALLGCCFETSHPMFICEYMPNGSLHDALFVHKLPLNWAQRVTIARDVASGLLYLHEETVNRIIHRDVKPANILLDEKMNARVADFGLARLVGDQEIDVITNVMGTRGYLAPEYALNGQLSEKVDVYSYGVVLLELVSGRHGLQPSRDLPESLAVSIVQWTWDMVSDGHTLGIADKDLDHCFYNEDFIRIVEIGLWCTQSHPQLRPTMNQVTRMLLKQARVPKLVKERTHYEARDFNNLPTNPFDESEWQTYVTEMPLGKEGKADYYTDAANSSAFSTILQGPKSSQSFEKDTVMPMSGLQPR